MSLVDNHEYRFQRFLKEFPKKVSKHLEVIDIEHSLANPYDLLKREFYERDGDTRKLRTGKHIGRIDVLFKYRAVIYAGEIKWYKPHSSEFWDATKIVAYTAYLNYQREMMPIGNKPYRPAVLVPLSSIKLHHKIVANRMKLTIFGVEEIEKQFRMMPIN